MSHSRKADLSQDLEDGAVLPGGETMLEILTRLQRYQESLTSQLEVGHMMCGCGHTRLWSRDMWWWWWSCDVWLWSRDLVTLWFVTMVISLPVLQSCSGTGVESVDQNVLLLKATSQAAVHSVKDCLALLRLQQQQQQVCLCLICLSICLIH